MLCKIPAKTSFRYAIPREKPKTTEFQLFCKNAGISLVMKESEVIVMFTNAAVPEICDYITDEILYGKLMEHEKITERAISEKFCVSRTIVRDALLLLKKEGWLYAKNKSGTYVAELDDSVIYENYQARLALEGQILMLAYKNITPEKISAMKQNCRDMLSASTVMEYSVAENRQHRLICEQTGNRYVINCFGTMLENMVRIGVKTGKSNERRSDSVREWLRIIDCLEKHNPLGASYALTAHIQNSYDVYESCYHKLNSEKPTKDEQEADEGEANGNTGQVS